MVGIDMTPLGIEKWRCTGQNKIDNEALRDHSLLLFNQDQRNVYNEIIACMSPNYVGPRCFFIDAVGGTGKTFVLNAILAAYRAAGILCLATASSGIAATLLKGGRTAHSQFGIPIPILPNSTCTIKPNSLAGKLLRESGIIVWDEVLMSSANNIKAVDRSIKDIMKRNEFFGNKIVVFSGDPRQTLPIIRRGNRAAIVASSLQKNPDIWSNTKKLKLTINMRVIKNGNTEEAREFAKFLINVGENNPLLERIINTNTIRIPNHLLLTPNLPHTAESLIDTIFPNIYLGIIEIDSAILTPKNVDCEIINAMAIIKYNEETPIVTLYSADVVQNEDGTDNINNNLYPIEFLNSVNVNGLPLHKLELKDGALVMLLRNLDVEAGLCNGTTLKVLNISSKVLKVQITNGSHTGDIALIPRINLTPTDTNLPFKISRRQFPVRLCFS